jgi:hypothetical protein
MSEMGFCEGDESRHGHETFGVNRVGDSFYCDACLLAGSGGEAGEALVRIQAIVAGGDSLSARLAAIGEVLARVGLGDATDGPPNPGGGVDREGSEQREAG